MNLAITTYGGDGGKSGISRYIIQLLREMAGPCSDHRVDVFAFADEAGIFIPENSGYHLVPGTDSIRKPIPNILWHQVALARHLRRLKSNVLFLPAANRRVPWYCPVPMVGTVHDFSTIHVEGKYDPARNFYIRRVLPMLVRRLSHVLTVSESSKRDIVEYAGVPPERVTVTPLAADLEVFHVPNDLQEVRHRLQVQLDITAPYILYTSRLEHPGKNHVRLIQAFDRWKSASGAPHSLVLAGSDWGGAEAIHQEAARATHSKAIRLLGFVPGSALPDLYAGADLFVFPSLYEGFGLPLLEAMACGAPVACARVSSLPEVAGDAAQYFDPSDIDDMARALGDVLGNPERGQQLREAGLARCREFSWKKTAQTTLEVLLRAAG
jgi:glycosyltransferase involved in cell wall biosynthesis